jgi:hypothetical protein
MYNTVYNIIASPIIGLWGHGRKYEEARKLHAAAPAVVEFPFPVCLASSSSSSTVLVVVARQHTYYTAYDRKRSAAVYMSTYVIVINSARFYGRGIRIARETSGL